MGNTQVHGQIKARKYRSRRLLPWLLVILVGIWALGFFRFTEQVRAPRAVPSDADAIVVLTGGEQRLMEALNLLAQGKGERLLISGVNPVATKAELQRLFPISSDLFDCCVDIDYAAENTIGNANETAEWVTNNGFSSLIVVTANYHMPRSLIEFERALPNVSISAYAIPTERVEINRWYYRAQTALFLANEYNKFLAAKTRIGILSALG